AQDVRRGQIRRMTQSALPLDDDDVRVFAFKGRDDLVFHLARAELRHESIQSDSIASSLNNRGLPGADQHGSDAMCVECLNEERGCSALADRTVCAENGDAGARHAEDSPGEE